MVGSETAVVVETVVETVGAGIVMVVAVMPQQEQALEYLETPEQALAYVGTILGLTVCWRRRRPGGVVVTVATTVVSVIVTVGR